MASLLLRQTISVLRVLGASQLFLFFLTSSSSSASPRRQTSYFPSLAPPMHYISHYQGSSYPPRCTYSTKNRFSTCRQCVRASSTFANLANLVPSFPRTRHSLLFDTFYLTMIKFLITTKRKRKLCVSIFVSDCSYN